MSREKVRVSFREKTPEDSVTKKEVILNRFKHGIAAAVGTAALIGLTAYKGYRGRDLEVNSKKMAKTVGSISTLFGVLWASTPSAKVDPKDTIHQVKDNIYPVVTAVVKTATGQAAEEENIMSNRSKPRASTRSYRSDRSDKYTMSGGFEEEMAWDDGDMHPEYHL